MDSVQNRIVIFLKMFIITFQYHHTKAGVTQGTIFDPVLNLLLIIELFIKKIKNTHANSYNEIINQ